MVIVFPIIPWGFLFQRPQQLALRLGKNGELVLYLAPTAEARPEIIKLPWSRNSYAERFAPGVFHYWITISRPFDVHREEFDEKLLNEMAAELSLMLEATKIETPCYLVQHPVWTVLVEKVSKLHPGRIVYDCMDEHSGFQETLPQALADEERLFRLADSVVVTSEALLTKAQAKGARDTALIRNGCDYDFFSAHPRQAFSLPFVPQGCVFGYYGSIQGWFDFELLCEAARLRSQDSFILVGHKDPDLAVRHNCPSNVHLLDAVPYNELPALLALFDVCLIPFKKTPLTIATNPVKIYEYFAAGKPVVSVRLPELETYKDLSYLYSSKDEFLQALNAAAQEKKDSDLIARRKHEAKLNSWDERALCFSGVINHSPELLQTLSAVRSAALFYEYELQARNNTWRSDRDKIIADHQAEIKKVTGEWAELLENKERSWQVSSKTKVSGYKDKIKTIKHKCKSLPGVTYLLQARNALRSIRSRRG